MVSGEWSPADDHSPLTTYQLEAFLDALQDELFQLAVSAERNPVGFEIGGIHDFISPVHGVVAAEGRSARGGANRSGQVFQLLVDLDLDKIAAVLGWLDRHLAAMANGLERGFQALVGVRAPRLPQLFQAGGDPRVVLVHDWLTGVRGGEKCLERMCRRWPSAPLYTLLYTPGRLTPAIETRPIHTSADGSKFHDHKGFNWMMLREMLCRKFYLEETVASPIAWLSPFLASQVWFLLRKK